MKIDEATKAIFKEFWESKDSYTPIVNIHHGHSLLVTKLSLLTETLQCSGTKEQLREQVVTIASTALRLLVDAL